MRTIHPVHKESRGGVMVFNLIINLVLPQSQWQAHNALLKPWSLSCTLKTLIYKSYIRQPICALDTPG